VRLDRANGRGGILEPVPTLSRLGEPGSHLLPRYCSADLPAVRLRYLRAGEGRTVLLLHDWPQSSYAWRRVIPELAKRYRLIVPDLRGIGGSGKPPGGYDKATIADDLAALMDHLGIERAHVVGHGVGAAVGYALAATHRDRARALVVIDMAISGFGLEEAIRPTRPGNLWYMAFHAVPELPELMIRGREQAYLDWLHRRFSHDPSFLARPALEEYARACLAPAALQSGLQYYRTFGEDAERNRQLAEVKLDIPVLALGGAAGLRDLPARSMAALAHCVESEIVDHCGHWLPEERPERLAERIKRFLHPARLRLLGAGRRRG
jgi:pimeloyl-ACP methyl ester carboxylesterase